MEKKNLFGGYLLWARLIVEGRLLVGADHSLESCGAPYCTQPTPGTMGGEHMYRECTSVHCTACTHRPGLTSRARVFTTLSVVPGHWRGNHTASARNRYHPSDVTYAVSTLSEFEMNVSTVTL